MSHKNATKHAKEMFFPIILKVLNFVKIVNPKQTILTNLNTDIDYNEIKKILPKNVIPAYDGMSFLI